MTTLPDTFANNASSTIAGGAGGAGTNLISTDGTVILATGDGAKFPSNGRPFMLQLGSLAGVYEFVLCTGHTTTSDTLTITRHQEGSTANNFAVGTSVLQVGTAGNMQDLWAASPQVFNVLAYGALANGSHDDTSAIQSAITAAQNNGGGVVLFPPGTYVTSATLSIPADTIILRGSGWSSVIKPVSSATFDVIATPIPTTAGASGYVRNYIRVEDLKIDCSNMTGTVAGQGNAIHFYGVRYSRITNVYVVSCPNWAILLDGDNTGPGNNFGYDNYITDNVFDLCAAGVYQTNCEANQFHRNQFKWGGSACAAAQPALGTQDTTAMHLRLGSGYATIMANVFGKGGSYVTEAIRCSNSGPCRVIGNRFDQVRNQCIVMNAGNHEFIGNQCGSPGSAATGVPAVQIGSSNNRVIGNVFDTTAGAISATYCIAESGGPFSGNIIADNDLLTGTTGFISLNATSTDYVHHNAGYNPRGHSVTQPAVPASTTAQTNTTGVDCMVCVAGGTVTAIAVGGTSTGLTSGPFRVPAGQTITLTYSSAPTWQWFGD